jgi:hypothetical protein
MFYSSASILLNKHNAVYFYPAFTQSTLLISRPRVLNLCHNQITCANHRQLVHRNRNIFPKHHRLHRNPAIFLQRINRRRTASRRDFARLVEFRALDVVCAEDVFLRS